MKRILGALVLVVVVACNPSGRQAQLVGNYGAEITDKNAISTTEMIAQLGDQDSLFVKVESEIVTTCTMKGCWMNLVLADGQEMRVTFKDYAFFVPKEGMEGNQAVIEGYVKRTLTDVATLQHYAEDAGKSETEIAGITEPKEEITFEASGVLIFEGED